MSKAGDRPPQGEADDRKTRLAQALRANLRKRKDQARGRTQNETAETDDKDQN